MTLPPRKKLIEVALPLEAINVASAREKSIRHGHPSTLHLWWARRPLAACRAVLFSSLVDDPSSDPDLQGYSDETRDHIIGERREDLHALIRELVKWENSNNPAIINAARAEIARSVASRKVQLGELAPDLQLSGGETVHSLITRGKYERGIAGIRIKKAPNPESVNAFLAEHAPPVLDPFCGGGSIPLEAQRLGLRAFGSDLNPVPVLITKALIEIPPKFAGMPPVNPEDRGQKSEISDQPIAPGSAGGSKGKGKKSKKAGTSAGASGTQGNLGIGGWKGAAGLAADVRYYGQWMRDEAAKRIGRLYPKIKVTEEMVYGSHSPSPSGRGVRGEGGQADATDHALTPALSQGEREEDATEHARRSPSPSGRGVRGEGKPTKGVGEFVLDPELLAFSRELRKTQTDAEALMWGLLRDRRLLDTKFRRQHPVDPYVLDFYCHEASLAVELDGGQHNDPELRAKDQKRTAFLADKGIRVIRFWNHDVLKNTEAVLESIVHALDSEHAPTSSRVGPHPNPLPKGEGVRRPDLVPYLGQELTVIAWLWARTVPSPNPAAGGAHVPLVRSFWLSTKKGKEAWVEPIVSPDQKSYRFEVRTGTPTKEHKAAIDAGTKTGRGCKFRCLLTNTPMVEQGIKSDAREGKMDARLMAIVAEGTNGRVYLSPTDEQEQIAKSSNPGDAAAAIHAPIANDPRALWCLIYGLDHFDKLFTNRQLVALTTFSDLVMEARAKVLADAQRAFPSPSGRGVRGEDVQASASDHALTPALSQGEREEDAADNAHSDARNAQMRRGTAQFLGETAQLDGGNAPLRGENAQLKGRTAQLSGENARLQPGTARLRGQNAQLDRQNAQLLGETAQLEAGNARLDDENAPFPGSADTRNVSDARLSGDDVSTADNGKSPEAYADAVATYLAFAVDKGTDYWSALCSWHSSGEKMRNTFGRQALPMVWDLAECNPFSESTGNWIACIDWVWKVVERSMSDTVGIVRQLDATTSINGVSAPAISTDPPYYDNIGYADLSDYFYVWLRRSLNTVYPALFRTLLTPKAEELIATPYRHDGSKERAMMFFEEGLGRAFQRMSEAENSDYPLTVFYAFKQSESDEDDADAESIDLATASTGWETMLEGLIKAGFAITGTWPMRTEMKVRMVGTGTNALASSIVLVCHPRDAAAPLASRKEFIAALKRELPEALRNLQSGNIAPVDLAQAAIGPGMAVFSRYGKVLETSGDRMGVRAALGLINQMLDEVLSEQEGEYDADTRWAIKWFEQYAHDEGPYGDAETLCKAMAVGVNGLVEAGIVAARSGKVRLLKRAELPADWDPATDNDICHWEVCQQLIRRLDEGGEQAAGDLLRKVGGIGEIARDLAYRLYTLCERKKWPSEALAYNTLVVAWPEIQKLAMKPAQAAESEGSLYA